MIYSATLPPQGAGCDATKCASDAMVQGGAQNIASAPARAERQQWNACLGCRTRPDRAAQVPVLSRS
jgi:hypothetical protein